TPSPSSASRVRAPNSFRRQPMAITGWRTRAMGFIAILAAACASEQSFDEKFQSDVQTVVVIYAENRGFDNIYGTYPNANGIPGINSSATGTLKPQTDRDSANTVLTKLPMVWGNLTAAGQSPTITQAQTDGKANAPFLIDTTYSVDGTIITRDLYHRFFE